MVHVDEAGCLETKAAWFPHRGYCIIRVSYRVGRQCACALNMYICLKRYACFQVKRGDEVTIVFPWQLLDQNEKMASWPQMAIWIMPETCSWRKYFMIEARKILLNHWYKFCGDMPYWNEEHRFPEGKCVRAYVIKPVFITHARTTKWIISIFI